MSKIEIKKLEDNMLKLLKVQSNLGVSDFNEIFGKRKGEINFKHFYMNGWNILSFMFNKINGEDRENFLEFINNKIKQL